MEKKEALKRFLGRLCAGVFMMFIAACSSTPPVSRVDAGTQTDLSGYWNDTDVRIVCDSLIKNCLDSPRMVQATAKLGRLPTVLVGSFKNESDEHIDTSILASIMEVAIFNSGRADFVAGGDTRRELRAERLEQMENASEKTAASLVNETGADFLLTGSIKTIIDSAGNTATRTYFVSAEMTDIETGDRIWMAQNSEIKKVIQRPKAKF